ncbi:hypothetical protein AJ80_06943 [Polytolypa hystricis UAMH7299]|uniref:Uncharacterized protein n=1 Tax=Polytolypa hystricis (strain UAMH7299) TaxID=1447883 RepID=A0A2B7XTG8_POLH7|nr:hypothetical protein AJ80_06943 [Polytolypa hystricis UAMH7299]
MMMTLLLLSLSLLLPSTLSQSLSLCASECEPITSRLSKCSLPAVPSLDWKTLRDNASVRNLAGLPPLHTADKGPQTHQIANYTEASCFCTQARNDFEACEDCFKRDVYETGNTRDEHRVIKFYRSDCEMFGYYAIKEIAYPSTTVTSMPTVTVVPDDDRDDDWDDDSDDDDHHDNDLEDSKSCISICGVISAQLSQCSLPSLSSDIDPKPSQVPGPGGTNYYGQLLFNRRDAECLCTLPVLRRFSACNACLHDDDDEREILGTYSFDCGEMGYWTDNKTVGVEADDLEGDDGGQGTNNNGGQGRPQPTRSSNGEPFPTGVNDNGARRLGVEEGRVWVIGIVVWMEVSVIFHQGINEISARGSITRICLAYLSCLDDDLDDESPVENIRKRFPLARYSAQYWMDHARPSETKKKVQESILNFFEQRQTYTVWGNLFDPDNPWDEASVTRRSMVTPLYYAALAGLRHVVKLLLEKGADVNAQDGDYSNALQATSEQGHREIVHLLLAARERG